MDRKYAVSIKGEFSGIYEWGNGFKDRNMADTWNWFWRVEFRKKRYLFWKYSEGDDFGGCGHLSSISGSIYMHPMDFSATLISTGGCVCISSVEGKDYYNHFQSELRELKKICDECAEFCGGHFTLRVSPEFRVEVPRPDKDYAEIEDYAKECGIEKEENEYIY